MSVNAAVMRIGTRVGVNPDTRRGWVKQLSRSGVGCDRQAALGHHRARRSRQGPSAQTDPGMAAPQRVEAAVDACCLVDCAQNSGVCVPHLRTGRGALSNPHGSACRGRVAILLVSHDHATEPHSVLARYGHEYHLHKVSTTSEAAAHLTTLAHQWRSGQRNRVDTDRARLRVDLPRPIGDLFSARGWQSWTSGVAGAGRHRSEVSAVPERLPPGGPRHHPIAGWLRGCASRPGQY